MKYLLVVVLAICAHFANCLPVQNATPTKGLATTAAHFTDNCISESIATSSVPVTFPTTRTTVLTTIRLTTGSPAGTVLTTTQRPVTTRIPTTIPTSTVYITATPQKITTQAAGTTILTTHKADTGKPTETVPTTTTKAPVTIPVITQKPAYVRKPDSKLDTLVTQVDDIYSEVLQLNKAFETKASEGDVAALSRMLGIITGIHKQTEASLHAIRHEITSRAHTIQTYIRLLDLELLRVEVQHYDAFLKAVNAEILSEFGDVSKFKKFRYSDLVSKLADLFKQKFKTLLDELYEVERLLVEAHEKSQSHGKLDAQQKAAVEKHLQSVVSNADALKRQITVDYYQEVERLREDSKELALFQRMEFELHIDLLKYVAEHVKKFEHFIA